MSPWPEGFINGTLARQADLATKALHHPATLSTPAYFSLCSARVIAYNVDLPPKRLRYPTVHSYSCFGLHLNLPAFLCLIPTSHHSQIDRQILQYDHLAYYGNRRHE